MKKSHIYLLVFVLATTISCGDDFLSLTPSSSIITDEVYSNEDDFNYAVLGTYAALRDQYDDWWEVGDLRADDVWQEQLNQTGLVLTDTFAGHDAADEVWNEGFSLIHRANTILEQIGNVEINNKDQLIGETKFLRALTYFNLVRIFGDTPMVTSPVLPNEAYQVGRISVDTIYNELIIPDLIEVINMLPDQYSGESVGRATKGAATALLGKVYLTIGSFVDAESTLMEVTSMGYELLDDFNDLYEWSNNKHHSEYIFDVEYSSNPGVPGSNWTNVFAPNWDIFRSHFGVSGLLHDSFTPTQEFYELFEENDLRKDITVANGITIDDGVFHELPTRLQSLMTLKYAISVDADNNSDSNWIVIRYADVLLMLAEAMNENGKTSEALPYLNKVRERAGLEPYSNLSQDEFRDAIELERRLELHGEGHRWFDLVRWGKALEILEPRGMRPYMMLWPIPLEEVDLINDPSILPQNPGYVGN